MKIYDLKGILNNGEEIVISRDGVTVSGTIKKSKGLKKRVIALALAAGIVLGSLTGCGNSKEAENSSEAPVTTAQVQVENPNLSFNPNRSEELVNRVTDFILDARAKGAEITAEEGINLYLYLNVDDLTPAFLKELNYQSMTEESLSRSFEIVGNILKEDTMTSRNDTIINVGDIIANKENAASVRLMQAKIAEWNSASKEEKTTLATNFNEYVNSTYLTDECRSFGYTTNVLSLKLLKGMETMSINSGVAVPRKDVADVLYYDGSISCLERNSEGKSKYSEEFTVAKEIWEAKLAQVEYDLVAFNLGYECQKQIEANVLAANIPLGVNPNIQAEREANDTTVYEDEKHPERQPVSPGDNIVNGEIRIPQTQQEAQQQQQAIQNQLEKENQQNDTAVAQRTAQEGAVDGQYDGEHNRTPKYTSNPNNDAYIGGYLAGYETGHQNWLIEQRSHDEIIDEEFIPNHNYDDDYDYDYDEEMPPKPDNGEWIWDPEGGYWYQDDSNYDEDEYYEEEYQDEYPDTSYDDEYNDGEIELAPGFHYGPDGKIYDSDGNEVELITPTASVSSSRSLEISYLKAVREELVMASILTTTEVTPLDVKVKSL